MVPLTLGNSFTAIWHLAAFPYYLRLEKLRGVIFLSVKAKVSAGGGGCFLAMRGFCLCSFSAKSIFSLAQHGEGEFSCGCLCCWKIGVQEAGHVPGLG